MDGFNTGSVSLYINNKKISEKEFKDNDACFDVVYDKEGENSDFQFEQINNSYKPDFKPNQNSGSGSTTTVKTATMFRLYNPTPVSTSTPKKPAKNCP